MEPICHKEWKQLLKYNKYIVKISYKLFFSIHFALDILRIKKYTETNHNEHGTPDKNHSFLLFILFKL